MKIPKKKILPCCFYFLMEYCELGPYETSRAIDSMEIWQIEELAYMALKYRHLNNKLFKNLWNT